MKKRRNIYLTTEADEMAGKNSKAIGLSVSSLVEKLIRENHARMKKEKKNAKD